MKKVNYKFVLVFVFSLLILSCSDDDKSSTEPNGDLSIDQALIGTWDLTKITTNATGTTLEFTPQQAGIALTTTFSGDGTFQSTTTTAEGTEVDSGTWGVKDGSLHILIEGEETETSPYTLNGNVAMLESIVPLTGVGEIPAILEFTKRN